MTKFYKYSKTKTKKTYPTLKNLHLHCSWNHTSTGIIFSSWAFGWFLQKYGWNTPSLTVSLHQLQAFSFTGYINPSQVRHFSKFSIFQQLCFVWWLDSKWFGFVFKTQTSLGRQGNAIRLPSVSPQRRDANIRHDVMSCLWRRHRGSAVLIQCWRHNLFCFQVE